MELKSAAAAQCSWEAHGVAQGMELAQGDLKVKFTPMAPPLPWTSESQAGADLSPLLFLDNSSFLNLGKALSLP